MSLAKSFQALSMLVALAATICLTAVTVVTPAQAFAAIVA
jgi:hypothetical protein